jgi:hypothetical protein
MYHQPQLEINSIFRPSREKLSTFVSIFAGARKKKLKITTFWNGISQKQSFEAAVHKFTQEIQPHFLSRFIVHSPDNDQFI